MKASNDRQLSATTTNFAIQSTPRHVAIIMDGNRRWARARGLPAVSGHRAGVNRLHELLPGFANSRVETLTLFAFSAANWQRCSNEVDDLLNLADHALRRFAPICRREKIRVEIIGRQDRLPLSLRNGITRIVEQTRSGQRRLRIAFDYSSREAIRHAASQNNRCSIDGISRQLCDAGDVDLLIRTGKEQRLSDFLLWECAFAELYFPDLYWPDFTPHALDEALAWFSTRNRRFGA
jgi:undecaprenyl diphosphate synthase